MKLGQSIRLLLKNPAWVVFPIVTLGLGIGATTAAMGILRAVVINAVPYDHPDELVILSEAEPKRMGEVMLPVRSSSYFQWREQASSFKDMLICRVTAGVLTGAGEPERVDVATVSSNTFDVLGVQPILGRVFTPAEDGPGESDVALISYALWKQRFAGYPGVIGRLVHLEGKPRSVLGVMPDGFRFPEGHELAGFTSALASFRPDVWVPVGLANEQPSGRVGYDYGVVARLKPGVGISEASSEMRTMVSGLATQYPKAFNDTDVTVTSFREFAVRTTMMPARLLTLGAIILLLMSLLNVSAMFTARMVGRRMEIAVRMAMGAGIRQLFSQVLVETLFLSIAGALLGGIVSVAGVKWLASLGGTVIPRLETAEVDWFVLLLSGMMAVVVGFALAVVAVWVVPRGNLVEQLKEGGRTTGGFQPSGNRWRDGLIIFQNAMSLILLFGFSLLAVSYVRLMRVDPGFQPDGVLTFRVQLNLSRHNDPNSWQAFLSKMHSQLEALPGVKFSAAIDNLPLTGDMNIAGTTAETDPSASREVEYRRVSGRYFETLGITKVDGRFFNEADTAESLPVAIISNRMAEEFWPGQNPIGKRFLREGKSPRVVVGVVADVKSSGLDRVAQFQTYVPYSQRPLPWFMFAIRTETDPAAMAGVVREAARVVDVEQPITNLETMEQRLAGSVSRQRFLLLLLSFFGVTALVLTAAGVFGMVSYVINTRLHEMGIRAAMGATQKSLFWLVVSRYMWPVALGIVVGILCSRLLVSYLGSQLYQTSPNDPLVYVLTVGGLCGVALIALLLPARRAATADPALLLRSQ